MPRFFKEEFKSSPSILGDDAKHIIKSLRMKVGETLTVSDTKGTDYLCEISNIFENEVKLNILTETENLTEPKTKATLFQCLPKGDKMDLIVRQAVELGVYEIFPVLSERCVSRPDKKSVAKKILRWQKIADEAAGQSGRGIKPKVNNLITFEEYCNLVKNYKTSLFFYESYGEPLKKVLSSTESVSLLVGCEGGFSVSEAEKAQLSGAVPVTLGKRILRCETAPTVALGNIMLLTNNLE